MYIKYRVSTLAELQQMIDDVLANAETEAGRKVDGSEVVIQCKDWSHAEMVASSVKLTDGSEVFNLEM